MERTGKLHRLVLNWGKTNFDGLQALTSGKLSFESMMVRIQAIACTCWKTGKTKELWMMRENCGTG